MTTKESLDSALAELSALKDSKLKWQSEYEKYKYLAQTCHSARDQFSVGWKKENACSISTLNGYNQQWDNAVNMITRIDQSIAIKQEEIDNLQKEVNENAQLALTEYLSSPEGQRELRKAEENDKNRKETTKRILIIAGIVIVIVVGVIVIKKYF